MPVYKDKERGTWFATYTYKDPSTNKTKRVKKRGFNTKKEAQQWEYENKLAPTKSNQILKIAFREISDQWNKNECISEEHAAKRTRCFEKRFAEFYNRPITEISKTDLVNWRSELAETDYATATKNDTVCFVKSIFKYASDVYDIPNPSTIIKTFKKTDEELTREMQVWTPAEFDQFIKYVDTPDHTILFKFIFWTGCRLGEALAIQKSSIKPDKTAFIGFSKRYQQDPIRPTKTKRSRVIDLDDKLYEELQPYTKGEGFLFGDPNTGLSRAYAYKKFKKAINESGVKKIRIHDLRHSHATWLINNGANIVAVSKRLGHSDINETLHTYTHLLQNSQRDLIDKINDFKRKK